MFTLSRAPVDGVIQGRPIGSDLHPPSYGFGYLFLGSPVFGSPTPVVLPMWGPVLSARVGFYRPRVPAAEQGKPS